MKRAESRKSLEKKKKPFRQKKKQNQKNHNQQFLMHVGGVQYKTQYDAQVWTAPKDGLMLCLEK